VCYQSVKGSVISEGKGVSEFIRESFRGKVRYQSVSERVSEGKCVSECTSESIGGIFSVYQSVSEGDPIRSPPALTPPPGGFSIYYVP